MELKDKLIKLRKEKRRSQIEVAEALNVSRQAISRWETGAAAPSTEKLIELSRLYGVSLDELVNGVEPGDESAADSSVQPRARSRRLLIALALALAILAAVTGAYMLGRGERDEIATDFEDLPKITVDLDSMEAGPWVEE